jgi:photosystem II stability/assembly factor-like uncharacterized protein
MLFFLFLAATWLVQHSGTTASLRGVSAISPREAWAGGTGGTYLHTTDGGATWTVSQVPDAGTLDFRDVEAIDAKTVYLMSAGPGSKSRIYKGTELLFTNPDDTGFFDAIAFWDARRGLVAGDAVGGSLTVITTDDGGRRWERRSLPPALPNEGAFAASGTCLIASGKQDAWIVSSAARVYHSTDSGRTWTVTTAPIRHDGPSAGAFSIAFSDATHGVIVGGDYDKPEAAEGNVAVTSDSGRTWMRASGAPPKGFRSAVAYMPDRRLWIAVGTSGTDVSSDNGNSWTSIDTAAYNALSLPFAVGPKGAVARLVH